MKNWILIIVILVLHLPSQAAKPFYTLSGRISDRLSEPVSFATLTFNDKKYITTVDVDGRYEIKLEKGVYWVKPKWRCIC